MRLARAMVRRRGWIAAAWAAGAALSVPAAGRIAERLQVSARVEGSESEAVERLLAGPLRSEYGQFAVLVVGGVPSPATAPGRAALTRIVASLDSAPEVSGTFSYLDTTDVLFEGASSTFVIAGLAVERGPADRLLPALRRRTGALAGELATSHPAVSLRWTGEAALNFDLRTTSAADADAAERRALPLTTLTLLVAFGTLAAALLPVAFGALAITMSLGTAAAIAGTWPLSMIVQNIATMLGLGLGIDYALLMVSRFRDALASGATAEEAATEAAHHAGHTILVSAAAVGVGFAALLTVPLNEIRSIAVGGMLAAAMSALLAMTLLPGMLRWVGEREKREKRHKRAERWRHYGLWVALHPWRVLVACGMPLLLLCVQALGLRTGLPRGAWLPASMESARALEDLRAMGRSNVVQTVRVTLSLPESLTMRRSAGWRVIARLSDSLAADPRVERVRSIVAVARAAGMGRTAISVLSDSVTRGLVSDDGTVALVELLPREGIEPEALSDFVRELRDGRASRMAAEPAAAIGIGGLPAFNRDYRDAVAGRFAGVAALVIGGTLIALCIAFRSVLIPVKAVALNLLSVGAAFGAVKLVFQDGHGARWIGVAEPLGAVFPALPVIVFAIVFGLSMDYEVFLVTRVAEARRAGHGERAAIAEGMAATGGVITSAAAIMVVVFGAFMLGEFLLMKMLGFALAVAVVVDATVVRLAIGPALLGIAGRWNWWPGAQMAQMPGRKVTLIAQI